MGLSQVQQNGAPCARYGFDSVGNLGYMLYANGVTNCFQYDARNRLTNSGWSGPAGSIGSLGLLQAQRASFDANDRLRSDTSDAGGNPLSSGASTWQYDSWDRLVALNGAEVELGYGPDGERVLKTVGSQTTYYLVDEKNPTCYAQVLEEHTASSGEEPALERFYCPGLALVSQERCAISGSPSISYYGVDGQGSVRFLTDSQGAVSDTYQYDAFGNLLSRAGSTENLYLYTGQQWDPDLGLYYLRARYYKPETGRFWTMDTYEGANEEPQSLHKYLYCSENPVNHIDPSGNFCEGISLGGALEGMSALTINAVRTIALRRLQAAVAQYTINTLAVMASTAVTVAGYELYDSYMVDQQFERIKTETAKHTNPTGSTHACVNFDCEPFERDAEKFFKGQGKAPQRISFEANEGAIMNDEIYPSFGWRMGLAVSENGYHEGCLVDGWVYDNFLPFGVPRRVWEKYCYFVEPRERPGDYISFRKAHNQKYGVIKPSPSAL